MKIEFKNNDIQVEPIKFPLLARLKKHGNIVLFTKKPRKAPPFRHGDIRGRQKFPMGNFARCCILLI